MQIDPFLKPLLRQFSGVGTDVEALLDRRELLLPGQRAFSVSRLPREHSHSPFRQPADDFIQRGNHGFDARDGRRIIRDHIRLLDDAFDRNRAGMLQCVHERLRTVKEQDLIGILAGFPIRAVRIVLHDHAARLVQPAHHVAHHLAAGLVVISEEDDCLELLNPFPAVINPLKVRTATRYGNYVLNACFVERHGVNLAFTDYLRLSERTKIHSKQDRSGARHLPFLPLLALRLSGCAEFDIDERFITKEGKNDVSRSIASDSEGFQRCFANLSSGKILDDLRGGRLDLDIRQHILLACLGGGAEKLRPLAKTLCQFLEATAHTTRAAFANVDALRQIERKGVSVAAPTAMADRAELGDLLIAVNRIGRKVPVCKRGNLSGDVHIAAPFIRV